MSCRLVFANMPELKSDVTIDFPLGLSLEIKLKREADIRGLIWDLWNTKNSGRVTATYWTKEGEKSVEEFHVTQNKDSAWVIKISLHQNLINHKDPAGAHIPSDSVNFAYRVDRIKKTKKGDKVIPVEKEHADPSGFYLRLKDESGKEIRVI